MTNSRNHSVFKLLLVSIFTNTKYPETSSRTFSIFLLSFREKYFRIIYSHIKGKIIFIKGLNTSLQHALFDRGKISYENFILLKILLNMFENRLVHTTSSPSIRNRAILEIYYINSLVYYEKREINYLVFIALVSNTMYINISKVFIYHYYTNMHRSYYLSYDILYSSVFYIILA